MVEIDEMGTACSVARSQSETNVSGGSPGKADQLSPGRASDTEKSQAQRVGANDEPGNRTDLGEPASEPVTGPSFSWLMSSPVINFQTGTDREHKSAKGKKPLTGKGPKRIVNKYGSEGYMKTWKHPAQLPTKNRSRQNYEGCSSSSAENYSSQYPTPAASYGNDRGGNKECRQARIMEQERRGSTVDVGSPTNEFEGTAVGFGVDRKR